MQITKKSDHGFILQTSPWRETSLLCEIFTKDHGRIRASARGARSPRSALRGLLIAFHKFEITWRGSNNLLTISGIEWIGPVGFLQKTTLLTGYYLNELILKLLAYADPHQHLFEIYWATIEALKIHNSQNEEDLLLIEASLRRFEVLLLREIGYGISFCEFIQTNSNDRSKVSIDDDYVYILAQGVFRKNDIPKDTNPNNVINISGKALLELQAFDNPDNQVIETPSEKKILHQQKVLLRALINNILSPYTLKTRALMEEIQNFRK